MVLVLVGFEDVVLAKEVAILALADPDTLSSSESLSKAASIALTFEFGVNWVGDMTLVSHAGEDSLVEAIDAIVDVS